MVTKVITSEEVGFVSTKNPDHEYWAKLIDPILTSLMKSTGSYTPKDIETQISTFHEFVVPNLGPRPSKANAPSLLTQTGCPVQPSVNLSIGKPLVRFSWEPLGPHGGSPSDLFAVESTRHVVGKLTTAFGLDTQWMDFFMRSFALFGEENQIAKDGVTAWFKSYIVPGHAPPPLGRLPFACLGFDLNGSDVGFKAYINPKPKEIATGIKTDDMMWNFLRQLKPALHPDVVDSLERFFKANKVPGSIELIGFDMVDKSNPSSARLKIYVSARSNSFNTVRSYVTMGGYINDSVTLKGLEVLHKVWHLHLQEPEGLPGDAYEKELNYGPLGQKTFFSFEIRPGSVVPEVKTYLPTWNYVKSDLETIQNFEEIFRISGYPWGEHGKYREVFESAFGPADLQFARPTHCDAAYLYSKDKGVYQTVYYSPQLAPE